MAKGPTLITSIRRLLTYANVMSTLLVFGALGGTSYAVTKLDRNSVKSSHIRNGQVKRPDLGRNSVNSSKVRDGRLLAADFAAGQVPQGERGIQGPSGVIQTVTAQREIAGADLPDGTTQTYTVFCPDGQKAIMGGGRGDEDDSEGTTVGASRPLISPADTSSPTDGGTFSGWGLTVRNNPGAPAADIRPEVWVFCAQE
jgi:hypothetical protein